MTESVVNDDSGKTLGTEATAATAKLPTRSDIVLKSSLSGPISQLDRMQRSLLFAEISMVSYYEESFVKHILEPLGFHTVNFYDRDGSQAYVLASDHDRVVACRGTEPHEWNDIKADANAIIEVETFDAIEDTLEVVVRVHRGFKREVDDLWPELEKALAGNDMTLWFTGHSLGGAMATICAGRCVLSGLDPKPNGLFTYGSPRVGDKQYINYCNINHVRWVNNNDIVTRVPPLWLGYRHHGTEMYLNCNGKLRRMSGWQRTKDRLRGFLRGLRHFKIDHFADHSITQYIDNIARSIQEQNKTRRD